MPTRHHSTFHRGLILGVLHVVRHPRRVLAIAAVVLVGCISLACWKVHITTDQNELFSHKVPFFLNYINYTHDFQENQAMYVLLEPKDSAQHPPLDRWIAIADSVTRELDRRPQFVRSVDSHVPLDELGNQALLFEDTDKLPMRVAEINRFAPLARLWGERAGLAALLGDSPLERFISGVGLQSPDEQTAQFMHVLADSWTATLSHLTVPNLAELAATNPSELGYYYLPDQQNPANFLMLIRVFPREDFSSMTGQSQILAGIRAAVQDAIRDFPEFYAGVTGRPALEADEMSTTDRDSRRSEIAALSAIFIGLVLLFRSVWLAIAAEIALLVGIGWTFGWIAVSVGELNLLSMVFLIALIGIGMDYLIQILTRYRRESAVHSDPRVIWAAVFKHVAAPINTACLGAAGAFFVAVFTDFRGAAQLGIIASAGLLLCLASGYIVLPSLLTLFPAGPAASPPRASAPGGLSHWSLVLPALWAVLLLCGISFARRTHFDPGLLNMQANNLESVKLVSKLQTWEAVVLSANLDELRKVRSAVQPLPTVASADSILIADDNYDWLQAHRGEIPAIDWSAPQPILAADLPRIAGKARALARRYDQLQSRSFHTAAASLDAFADALPKFPDAAAALSNWQDKFVAELQEMLAEFSPPRLQIDRLPLTLRNHFIGSDGRYALYIEPRDDLWQQANLVRFVTEVESAVAAVPGAPPVTGIAADIYHSTFSIEKSFYQSTAYALGLIFILVLIDMGNLRQTFLAISVLAMGLPMLLALMGIFHINWNFANFFGLPILIGAGHEYGVFMVHRYNEARRDPRRVWQRWDVSDRALLLCAFVTSVSFGFFWALAHHQGLRSLGLVMALGTACIYLAALCVLRPLLRWNLARRALSAGR